MEHIFLTLERTPPDPHTPVPDHHQGEGRGTARRRCPDAHDPSAVRSHPRDLGDARRDRANPHHVHPLRHASAPWARCDDVASIHHRDRRSLGAERGGEAQTCLRINHHRGATRRRHHPRVHSAGGCNMGERDGVAPAGATVERHPCWSGRGAWSHRGQSSLAPRQLSRPVAVSTQGRSVHGS
jgi:hypothetical protein